MRRRMGVLSLGDSRLNHQAGKDHGAVLEEIVGLIRVYKNGHVDRLPAVSDVPCTWAPEASVTSRDVVISHSTGVWARFYVPKAQGRLPLLVYFHGGGFCVGSAAWSCYHEFLARLASRASCLIMSVNYRLAPENRLPAAYEDGLAATRWVRQQASYGGSDEFSWWRMHCNFARVFLGGDSAGATIAHNVAAQLGSLGGPESVLKPICLRGVILIQPFIGGEARTASEKDLVQSSRSALGLTTSDCYWRLALPFGCNRDHPWCNPLAKGAPRLEDLKLPPLLVCVSEMDILRDRNLEFCKALRRAGKSVEQAMYAGVGHAFQVLHNHHMSQARTHEMLAHMKAFISNR
ncbi:probable carboxylesterase 17 [Phoenix dactylifera]|uniref:Probable carboxylesterase 17 n=1 Tax=Phoenix dactylifera TaxID=42345 RepID=A0A8B7BF47_PHODC|nr:probable carboxylesterase 17 [Phoenix dactylifera]